MSPRGTSPIGDLRTLLAYRRALAALRPAALLGFTSKPNIYGALAAHSLGIPVINNISGLGAVFANDSWLTRVVSTLYKAALRRSATVFFQNRDDQALFERRGLVKPGQSALLPGSGIDLDHFAPAIRRRGGDGHTTFLFAARLLWDKGVLEFVEAARQVRQRFPQAKFRILGMIEPPERPRFPKRDLRAWDAEGAIEYIGAATDVRQAFGRCRLRGAAILLSRGRAPGAAGSLIHGDPGYHHRRPGLPRSGRRRDHRFPVRAAQRRFAGRGD